MIPEFTTSSQFHDFMLQSAVFFGEVFLVLHFRDWWRATKKERR